MSFPGSDYEKRKAERTKAYTATWNSLPNINIDQSLKPDDKPLTEPNTDTQSKYVPKYGATGKPNSFLISQRKKKKQPGELDDDDISDLSNYGYSGQGARIIDERTYVLDEGGWTVT